MTVGALIARLSQLPAEMEIKALWDAIPDFDVHRVEVLNGVAIIDCGADADGDWWMVEQDIARTASRSDQRR